MSSGHRECDYASTANEGVRSISAVRAGPKGFCIRIREHREGLGGVGE